jgi:iron complex outermembrane receptor protein
MLNEFPIARILRHAFHGGLAGIALVAAPAFAQSASEQLERIEVTGSNIKRTDTEGVSPVQVITRQDIERSGQPTIAELIRSISANSGQSFNETFTNSFSPGASGVALRGLSQKNTLVLLNGRRVATYGFAQNLQDAYVDLNSIPIAAVERVEVLKDGASAVYGSDAIAGVINVILRKDFQGGEVAASYGKSSEGGMGETQASATVGFGNPGVDRFNVMISANYFKRDLLRESGRDYIDNQDFRRFGGLNGILTSAGTYQLTGGANPARVPFSTCGSVPGSPGFVQTAAQLGSTLTGSFCAYNPAPFLTLFPGNKREQVVANGTFDITPSFQAFTDLAYSHTDSFQPFTPTGFSSTSVAFDPTTGGVRRVPGILPVGNPSNPFTTPTNISYTFFDVGERDSDITSNFYRVLGGLKGSIGKWDWEVAAFHSDSKENQHNFNQVDAFVLNQVVANGTYNFLNPSLTPGVTNALRIDTHRIAISKMDGADARATGELFTLPAGPVGFATGVEFRRETVEDDPDALLTSGHVLGSGATQTQGSRRTTAGYAEFSVPIIRTVEASLAAREDHYSDFGSAFSPKVGLKWQPIPELLFRTTASKGFRAPTLQENSRSSATFFTGIVDPNAPGGPANVTVAGVFSGNPALSPERSKNYNAGFVLSPDSTTSIGLDFYSIEQKDLVGADSFQFIANNPALFPGQLLRDPVTGNLISITAQFRNLTALRTEGYDLDFKKSVSFAPLGKFTLSGTWTYIQTYKTQAAAGQPLQSFVGRNDLTALPRTRGTTSLTWEYQAFTTSLTYYYTGAYSQQNSTTPQVSVGAYRQYDMYVSWEGIKNLKLYASVQNLADTHPPFDAAGGTLPFDFTLYDARGRFYRAGMSYKFF